MARLDVLRLFAALLIGSVAVLGCLVGDSNHASAPATPTGTAARQVAETIVTQEQAAAYALAVLAGEHWDTSYKVFQAIDPVVAEVEQSRDGADLVWDVGVTGRFEISSCPVRVAPTLGTDICNVGDQAVVNIRIGERFATVLFITRTDGFQMQMPVNSSARVRAARAVLPAASAPVIDGGSPSPSADAGCIPVVTSVETPPRGIYRMRADGSELCLLAIAGVRADNPVWSPDGQYIAFVRATGEPDNFEVVVIDADGSNERNVSNSPSNDSAPAWLPGFPHLLTFVSHRDNGQNIYRVDPSEEEFNLIQVTRDVPIGFDLEWSPDGVHYAYSSSNVAIAHVARSGVRPLVPMGLILDLWGSIWPAWSPDGQRIAFEVDRALNGVRDHEIYAIDTDGKNIVNLTNNLAEDNAPSWSPDGTMIAFASNRDGYRSIYVMNADGSNIERLTHLAGDAMDSAWSPDGRYIVFTTAREWASH